MTAIPFDNSYARLPGTMHAGVLPTPVKTPRLIKVNEPLARELGIDPAALTPEMAVGNVLPTAQGEKAVMPLRLTELFGR